MGKTYWMLVTDQENFEITRKHGFSVQGVDSKQRRKAVRMGPDDRVVYYISDRRAFAATATITSQYFEDHERIWTHHQEQEDVPHRVKMRPDVVLEEGRYVDALEIGFRLEYVRKWPPELWPLAFLGSLHILPQKDFNFLEEEMRRVTSRRPRATGRKRRGRGRSSGKRGGRGGARPEPAAAESSSSGA